MVCHPSTSCLPCSQLIWTRRQLGPVLIPGSSEKRCGRTGRRQKIGRSQRGLLRAAPQADMPAKEESTTSNNPKHPWENYFTYEVNQGQGKFSPETVRHIIGIRHWRLNGLLGNICEFLASEIEGFWRQLLMNDLRLSTLPREKKFFDSLDPDGSKGEAFTRATDDPGPLNEGYPRMFLESREYSSTVFRKLHINLGSRQDGVEVMHVLMIPYPQYDIPMFYMEVIGVEEQMTYFALDLVPVSKSQDLPELYETGMQLLRKKMGENNRETPKWLQGVCSKNAFVMVPKNDHEAIKCVVCAGLLTKSYILSARNASFAGDEQQLDIYGAHERFYRLASTNAKTQSILEMSFSDPSFMEMFYQEVLHDVTRNADEYGYNTHEISEVYE